MNDFTTFDDLIQIVKSLTQKKNFLDDLQIPIAESDFTNYTELFNYPHALRAAIKRKAETLGREQIVISMQIKDHVD